MAVMIKCKMCGGDLHITEGSTVCECEYCGTKQTVPTLDNEKKLTLFARAGRLLRNCEFDKASGVFESIVAEFPEEAEAYWGLVLCKYGIEYVDDPATGKKIPTCHRSSFDSVFDDTNYEQACENTDAVARRVYRDEARQLEELRKSIIEVSGKEESYDIFISYKETDENGNRTLDSVIAQDIYTEFTEKGYRVFFSRISLEDKLGVEYEPYIFAALNSAKVMLVVGTDYEYFDAVWVKNEWSRFLKLIAGGQKKVLIPVFKNMDPYDMPREFSKLAAQDMGKVGAMQDLLRGIEKLLSKSQQHNSEPQPLVMQAGGPNIIAMVKRGQQALEDAEWNRADDFFDQALNMDAECAEAFIGKFCAKEHVENLNAALRKRMSIAEMKAKDEVIEIPHEDKQIKEAITESIIPNYLSEEQIVQLISAFDFHYCSKASSLQQIAQNEIQVLKAEKDIIRALKYAQGTLATKMHASIEEFEKQLLAKVTEAQSKEKSDGEQKAKEYADYLQETLRIISAVKETALQKREQDYQSHCRQIETANSEAEYNSIIYWFEKNIDYKDSEKRIEQCRQLIIELEETERQRLIAEKNNKIAELNRELIGLQEHKISPESFLETDEKEEYTKLLQQKEKAESTEREKTVAVQEIYKQIAEIDQQISFKRKVYSSLGLFKGTEKRMVQQEIDALEHKKCSKQSELTGLLSEEDDAKSKTSKATQDLNYFTQRVLDSRMKIVSLLVRRTDLLSAAGQVIFGSYQGEKIEWLVLELKNDKALLLSKYILDFQQYHSSSSATTAATWKNCTLRSWLNDSFLKTAFLPEEQSQILTSTVTADTNPRYRTDQGINTSDKIFLLSISEANKYLPSDSAKVCKPTVFAETQSRFVFSGCCRWWLRTLGRIPYLASDINYSGSLDENGSNVNEKYGIRPAMWLSLKS